MRGGFLKGRERKGLFGGEVSKNSSEKSKSLNVIEKVYGGGSERTGASSSKPKYITDKGRSIAIGDPEQSSKSPIQYALDQARLRQRFKSEGLYAKQLSAYDPSFNCHSYTFTDGKAGPINHYADVERILEDNFRSIASRDEDGTYTYTQEPQEGDIIIYWDKYHANALHSGVISRVENDPKKMMVKSKMGNYGLYEHSALIPKFEALETTHWEIYHRPQGRLITEASCSNEE